MIRNNYIEIFSPQFTKYKYYTDVSLPFYDSFSFLSNIVFTLHLCFIIIILLGSVIWFGVPLIDFHSICFTLLWYSNILRAILFLCLAGYLWLSSVPLSLLLFSILVALKLDGVVVLRWSSVFSPVYVSLGLFLFYAIVYELLLSKLWEIFKMYCYLYSWYFNDRFLCFHVLFLIFLVHSLLVSRVKNGDVFRLSNGFMKEICCNIVFENNLDDGTENIEIFTSMDSAFYPHSCI